MDYGTNVFLANAENVHEGKKEIENGS